MNMTRYNTRAGKMEGEGHVGTVIGLPAWVKYCIPHGLASVASKKI